MEGNTLIIHCFGLSKFHCLIYAPLANGNRNNGDSLAFTSYMGGVDNPGLTLKITIAGGLTVSSCFVNRMMH